MSIRFLVGSEGERRSSSWRLWTKETEEVEAIKKDIYVTTRPLGGVVKISLHDTGEWQFSFTSEFVEKMMSTNQWDLQSRHIRRWKRPAEVAPGVTIALRIYIAESELRLLPWTSKKKVYWVPKPKQGHAVEFLLLITSPSAKVSSWPGKNGAGTIPLTKKDFKNGETCWLLYRFVQVPASVNRILDEARKRIPESVTKQFAAEEGITRAVVFGSEKDGSKVLYEIAIDTS